MKNFFALMSMAAAMILFAGCQKNEIEGVDNTVKVGSTFELVADIAQTKTTLEGYSVNWEDGDIIYMVTKDGEWGVPYNKQNPETASIAEFKYVDGKFTTESTISDGEHIFNAVYYNGSQKTYHRSDKTTHQLSATQSQDCTNPTAHIKAYDALVGTFTATTPMNAPASVNMQHIYTLMQIDVKNNTTEEVQITKFEMTASGADLAGIFNVTAFDTPVITPKEDEAATETIVVNVSGGAVANGKSLPIYFVMAPITNYAGDVTFKATDANGNTYTMTKSLSGLTFAAGAYNTATFIISEADEVIPSTGTTATLTFDDKAKRTEYTTSKAVWKENGVTLTNNKSASTTNIGDYANPARFYKSSEIVVEVPGNITVIKFDCTGIDSKYVTPWGDIDGATLSNNIVTFELDGTSSAYTFKAPAQIRANSVTVTYVGNGEGGETPDTTPSLNLEVDNLELSAEENEGTINVTANNIESVLVKALAEEGSQEEVLWLSVDYSDNVISYYAEANESEESRNAYIEVSALDADGNEIIAGINVIQAGYVNPDVVSKVTIAEFKNLTGNEQATYELSGTVSSIYEAYNPQYKNISFYLQDETGKVLIFRMTCDPELGNAIRLNDQITVQGKPTLYNESIQMAQGGECVAYTQAPYLELLSTGAVVKAEETTYSISVNSNTIWTVSSSTGVTLDKLSGEGNAVVNMEFPANTTDEQVEHIVTFTYGEETVQFTLTQYAKGGDEITLKEAELSFANKAQRTSFSTSKQVWEQNEIKLTNDKGSSTSNVADYANPARFYKSSKLTIEAPGNIEKIVFTCNSSSYATALKSSISTSLGTVNVSGSDVTVVPSNESKSFVINSLTGGQVRMNKLIVTYQKQD